MDKFGVLKNKVLTKLTESYQKQDKTEIKNILNLIKEDKDFRSMYLFYDDFENKYFDNVSEATLYVEEITPVLKGKLKMIYSIIKKLCGILEDINVSENEIYASLDRLCEEDRLDNIDKKILAKKKLIEHLTTKKNENVVNKDTSFTSNEKLLHSVLTNNFNILYDNILDEDQKVELKNYLSMTDKDVESEVISIKEEIINKVDSLLNENNNPDLSKKLEDVRKEVSLITPSKVNLYRLKQLKNGFN